jgi:release factor glutamine methyltransferase
VAAVPYRPRVMTSEAIIGRLRAAGCVFAEDEAAILVAGAQSPGELEGMVAARVSGLPLEQVIGWAEFRGLRILVDPGVFVPRRRSEFLVETALSLCFPLSGSGIPPIESDAVSLDPPPTRSWAGRDTIVSRPAHDHGGREATSFGERDVSGISPTAGLVVVDLCCGTGALGLAVLVALNGVGRNTAGMPPERGLAGLISGVPGSVSEVSGAESSDAEVSVSESSGAELHAADLDPAAVACARRNVEPAGGRVYHGDLFAPLPATIRGRVSTLICNAPYVPASELGFMPAEARDHEARMALDGGADGLAVLRRAATQAPGWLAPGATMLVETSERQAPAMAGVMTAAGLLPRVHADDEMGATVVTGTMPVTPPARR